MPSPTPQAPPPQSVDVEFKATGLGKLKSQWADFTGSLLAPIAVLAAGGTKTQAAWAGMKDVLLTKVLGPIGLVAGAATGFLLVTRNLIKEWRAVGVQSAKAIETLTLQFKPLLGSLELAKKRAREVFAFSVTSPFKFAELAAGNKVLEGLTRGALSGKKGMELVGDAAAVAGAGFEETARSVGRLYDGIMSGRPVGEAGMRLQELGLISGQTRNQIEAMTAANAAGSAIWAMVQKDLERTKGAMNDLSASLEGLESTYADTRNQLAAGFGQGFLEGEKTAIKSATGVIEKMTPAAVYLGETIGSVSNFFAKLKAQVIDTATSIPGLSTVITAAAVAVTGLAASIAIATGGMIAKFVAGLLSAVEAQKQLTASVGSVVAAEVQQTAVTGALAAAKRSLAAASALVKAGNYAQAASELRLAAVSTVAAIRTNALAASQGILRGALMLTMSAVRFVTRELIALSATILATPMFWIAAALVIAGGAMLHFHNKAKKAKEALDALATAARDTVSSLRQQAAAIRTVADLRKTEADVVAKLSEAYSQLRQAREAGGKQEIAIAESTIRNLRKVQAAVRDKSGKTELEQPDVAREDALKEQAKAEKRSREDFKAGSGEASALEVARQRAAEGDARKATEEKAMAAEKALREAQDAARRGVEDTSAEQGSLEGRRKTLLSGILDRRNAEAASVSGNERAEMEIELKQIEQKLAAMREIKALAEDQVSKLALDGGSELAALKEKLAIYEELESAGKAYEETVKKVSEAEAAGGEGALDAIKSQGEAFSRKEAARRRAELAGVSSMDPRGAQNAARRVSEIEAQRAEALDPAAAEERRQALVEAELGLVRTRIDAEAQVASLRLKGYEREKAMLGFEREKLQAASERGRVDQDSYNRQAAALDAQQQALDKSGREKGMELREALEIANLNRREAQARRGGDGGQADRLRALADAREEARIRREAAREAEDVTTSPANREAFVNARVAEEKAARDAQRRNEEQDRALGRSRSLADQDSAAAELKAQVLRSQGRSKEARQVREEAARAQDEVDRREKQRSYRDQGFGAKDADRLANVDVKNQQAQRLIEEMMGRQGFVVADSLAKVGGGGNVSGADPATRLQERMVRLLEEVADNTKDNVETIR